MLHVTHRAPTLRYKSLHELRRAKGKVQKPSGRWWDDEKNVWTTPPEGEGAPPKKRSKKPKDSSSKPVPQSYNTGGEEPTSSSTDGGKKVGKPKAPKVEKKPKLKVAKNGRYVTPEGDVRNMNFKKIDDRIDLIKLSLTGEDPVAIQAMADMEEEGTLDLPPRSDPRRIREMVEAHGTAGAARVLLKSTADMLLQNTQDWFDMTWDEFEQSVAKSTRDFIGKFSDESEYALIRIAESLGWRVGYRKDDEDDGAWASPHVDPMGPRESRGRRYSSSNNRGWTLPRPAGGACVNAEDDLNRATTMTAPSREAYEKYEDAFNRIEEAHKDSGVIRSNTFIAEVSRLAPSATPLEVWDAVAYMVETGRLTLGAFSGDQLESMRANGLPAPDEPLDGFSANDGVLWIHGQPALMTWTI